MIVVTGGTGLVGAQLISDLLVAGHEVKAIKRQSSSLKLFDNVLENQATDAVALRKKLQWVDADILDYFTLKEEIKSGDMVFHCAAMVSFDKKDREELMNVNVEGTRIIVSICQQNGVKKLCHVSSIAAIGRGESKGYCNENHHVSTLKGKSNYSISKYEAEQIVWRGIAEGLDAVIVNPSVILGSGDWSKGSSKLFQTVDNGLKFYTNGTNGYVDVKDVSRAMIQLMFSEISGQRFILNAGNITYKQLFTLIANGLNKKPPPFLAGKFLSAVSWISLGAISFFTGKRPLITRETAKSANSHYFYDASKISNAISFSFTSLDETIERVSADYLNSKKH